MPKVSIIIRAKNEARYLPQVLASLKRQTFKDWELILVDNESLDKTVSIAKSYGAKVISIKQEEFNYPYACNVGARLAQGELILYLSGHSIPLKDTWLAQGVKNFVDDKVAGVYATTYALPEATFAEKIFYNIPSFLLRSKRFTIEKISEVGMGVLGFTNAIIRRDLWEKRPLDMDYARGGEDGDWARYWVGQGYKIVHDPDFRVYHSHNLGLLDLLKQFYGWIKMRKPSVFVAQKNKF